MHGEDDFHESLFTVIKLDDFALTDRPLSPARIRVLAVEFFYTSAEATAACNSLRNSL